MTYLINCPEDKVALLQTFLAENRIVVEQEVPATIPAWHKEELLRREKEDTHPSISWEMVRQEYVGRGL